MSLRKHDEKELILRSEEGFIQHDVKNKQLNENENNNENEEFKNKIVKDSIIKGLIEKPKEIKSPNWFDKNKFKEILTIIDSNNLVTKIGDFKYIDIKD